MQTAGGAWQEAEWHLSIPVAGQTRTWEPGMWKME